MKKIFVSLVTLIIASSFSAVVFGSDSFPAPAKQVVLSEDAPAPAPAPVPDPAPAPAPEPPK